MTGIGQQASGPKQRFEILLNAKPGDVADPEGAVGAAGMRGRRVFDLAGPVRDDRNTAAGTAGLFGNRIGECIRLDR